MSYPIERDVPLPDPQSRYRWGDMEVGDSFMVPITDKAGGTVRAAASWANMTYPPKRWTVRVVDGGHRVWRVA